MSLPAPYSEVYLAGDGVSTVFAFGDNFDPISDTLVECKIYFPGGYETVPTFTVDMATRSITISALTQPDGTILTAPPVGSTVRIYRDEPEAQNITASQLQSFTAKQLESALDAIVAMIQEVSYTVDHKTVRLTEPQRDIALQELSQLVDQHLIYWDFDSRKLVVTNFPQQDVVRCVNGLFFRIKIDPDTQHEYLQWSLDESDWHSVNVDAVQMLAQDAYDLADDAFSLATHVNDDLNSHEALRNNPHETSFANLIDTEFENLEPGQFAQFDGLKWVNVNQSTTVAWGGIEGNILEQEDLQGEFATKVNDVKVNNVSVVTNNIANIDLTPYARLDTAQTFTAKQTFSSEIEARSAVTLGSAGLLRALSGNTYYDLIRYNVSRIEVGSANTQINLLGNGAHALYNGNDIAMKSEVDLAANSGRMITDQGLWYAKMYSATVAPSAADGTNYADFSQVDGQGNPIIVTYNRVNGAWVQDQTITPPADYDGYVSITSKIWDIAEQTGPQGGRVLWNHQSKEFTPYPQLISFDSQTLTNCTLLNCVITLPNAIARNSAVNAGYVIDRQNTQDISDETFVATSMTIALADAKTIYFVDATADTEIIIDASNVRVVAGMAKTFEVHVVCGATIPVITWQGIDNWLIDSETSPSEANATSIFALRVQQRPSDATPIVVANYGGAY